MSKGKQFWSSAMVLMITAAVALVIAGCANKTNGVQGSTAPTVTTENGQSGGSSDQQQPANGQSSTGSNQAPANGQSSGRPNPQQMQANIQKALAGLVSKGTITQTQADKVIQVYATNLSSRQPSSQSSNQSSNQSSANHQRGQRPNPLAALVTNGTLTQNQANAVETAIRQAFPHPNGTGTGSGQTSQQQ